jgi:hypothetical protein
MTWFLSRLSVQVGRLALLTFSVTLFCDNQTAVVAGNGASREKLMVENTKNFHFGASSSRGGSV